MIVLSPTELHRQVRRSLLLGILLGAAVFALAINLAKGEVPVPAAPAEDPRMEKLCHWPSKPGEGLVAVMDEHGIRRCWELR